MVDERGVDDIRDHGAKCNGVANDAAAIEASIATGAMSIFLPDGTLWVPDRNYVPGNRRYIGENWKTVIIKAANPENEYIVVGPHAELVNVAIFDQVEPGWDGMGRKSPRPVRQYLNLCSGDAIPTHYAWTGLMTTSSGTGQDLNALTLNGRGVGDVVFIGADQSATGLDIYVNSEDPNESACGVLAKVSGKGPGLHIIGRETCKQTYALTRIEQRGKGPSLMFEPGTDAGEVVVCMLEDGTGQCFHVYQHTGTYDGTPIALNMGRNGGTFTSSPFWYRNGEGPMRFELMNDGSIASEQMTTLERRIADLEQKLAGLPQKGLHGRT